MKRRIISLSLVIAMLLCSNVWAFSDVSDKHWAKDYINKAQELRIINGYTDNTFKPENKVKTGEFIKMVARTLWPQYLYKAPEEGVHWAMPYVESLHRIVLIKSDYNVERLERVITRTEAARLLVLLYANKNGVELLDNKEEYIQNFTDSSLITNSTERMAIDECVKFGLINGFEDGTFRPNDGLTRAQAAKILSLVATEE